MTLPRSKDELWGDMIAAEIPRLRRYALVLTRLNADAAADLVQDCLVRALTKRHLWQEGTDLRAWLFTILHNVRVNQVRRLVREGSQIGPDALEAMPARENTAARTELAEVREALARLPRGQQRLIMAAALTDDDYDELAVFEDVPVGTVRSRLHRGRAMLRVLVHGSDISAAEREKIDA